MADSFLLECQDLTVMHGKKIRALYDFSMHVQSSEIVALIGANGAGKSSFLKTISGLLRLESGNILFESFAIQNYPSHKIASLGIAHVPEGRHIFSRLSVLENLELGGFLMSKLQVEESLEQVMNLFPILKERARQLGGTLSGGEQQMLAMARALMLRPKLMMLDEPSMGLAPIMVDKIFQIIHDINAQGTTILLVEQNAYQSLSIAHRAYVLETGTIMLEGTGKELLNHPQIQKCYLGTS